MSDLDDELKFKLIEERERFLELLAAGVPARLAGHELRWTPKQIAETLADQEFAELVEYAIERSLDGIEATLHAKAQAGNMAAIQMVLFNRRPERWRDIKRIEVHQETTITIGQIEVTKQAALALLAERGAAVMQQLSGPIEDAEVITDGEAD